MNTKLVYVLTSEPEKNYIEQALMSVYTARFYNPDTYIVLIVDDLTDKLLTGKRAEVLEYVSEKKVIKLADGMPMMERSRQLKTSSRKLLEGNMLYIDSDTIVTGSLKEIDNCQYEIAAVLESHLPVKQFNQSLFDKVQNKALILGWDALNEVYYYSSGVIFAKDSKMARHFFERWNYYWNEGNLKGVAIDQPSLAKANIECAYQIGTIDNIWNCVMYTHPLFDRDAKIMHFCSYQNMSYVFGSTFLKMVEIDGVTKSDFVKYSILNPYKTYIPFENRIYHFKLIDYISLIKQINEISGLIFKYLAADYSEYLGQRRFEKLAQLLFKKKFFLFGAIILVLYKSYRVKFSPKYNYAENICSI